MPRSIQSFNRRSIAMKQPPVRELLATYLRKRRDVILRRLMAMIDASPELADLHELAHTPEYRGVIGTLLDLLIQNIADPADRRCFHYARQRAFARFQQNIQATRMLRLAAMHRQILTRMIALHFEDEATLVRRMTEIIETQSGEIETAFTDAYQSARDQQWHYSETKYYSLFENASEAIISFRPQEGRIIEANVQAERLLGRARADIMEIGFSDLFAPEHREQSAWLVEQSGNTSSLRLEDMAVRREDGLIVPISLSCNWVQVEGASVAQVIMRDVTQLRQMQRELQSYAEQLEERVQARTTELQQSEDRYRTLFLQEQRRAQQLSLINDVQQCALVTRDIDEFLHHVTSAIQSHFRDCDVSFYVCRGLTGNSSSGVSTSGDQAHDSRAHDAAVAVSRLSGAATDLAAVSRAVAADARAARRDVQSSTHAAASCDELVVVAHVGGHGFSLPVGGRHPVGEGLPGRAASGAEGLLISNDTSRDPRYYRPPGVHREAGSEMCVPVAIEGDMIGVISVQSAMRDTFDPRDAVALQTAATIAAAHVQSSRMFHDMSELKEFNETLVGTMLHSLMVVNRDGLIQIVNDRLCQSLRLEREELINQKISRVFNDDTRRKYGLDSVLRDVTESGAPREMQEVHVWVRSDGQPDAEYVFDLRISRVYFRGEAQAVVLLINLTARWRKTRQLQIVNEMSRLFQSSLDIDRVLHTVLTCITAGPALGFNRAFLLLLDEESKSLRGAMALGPSSHEEASRIWRELGSRQPSLQEILGDETAFDPNHPTKLQQSALSLQVDLQDPHIATLARAVRERRTLLVTRDELFPPEFALPHNAQWQANGDAKDSGAHEYSWDGRSLEMDDAPDANAVLHELFTAPHVAIAPLASKDRIVGVVLADNLYSGTPIEDDDLRLLDTVAQQAGLTIDNALTYQALSKAQREVASAERLVAVGEMAARVSHEIRNPLSTIGGFARSLLKRPDDADMVRRKTEVIVEEVSRLEELLTDLLDMARPRELDLQPHSINDIAERALLLANADIKASGVEVEKHLTPDPPLLLCDGRRLLQCLLNAMRNAAQAMPDGGTLTVETHIVRETPDGVHIEFEVCDTGVGIPQKALKQVFDPFFSTKMRGSGLGLPVTLRIIRDHGGDINVYSEEGEGTRFVISLPLRRPQTAVVAPVVAPVGATDA